MNLSQKNLIVNFIKDNYEAMDHLKPSVADLEKYNLTAIIVWDIQGTNKDIAGVTFCNHITETLMTTRTTIVKNGYRGMGIGKLINEGIEKYAKENSIKKICCNVYVDNLPSLFLKLKRGYIVEGLLKDHDSPGMHEYLLSKFI